MKRNRRLIGRIAALILLAMLFAVLSGCIGLLDPDGLGGFEGIESCIMEAAATPTPVPEEPLLVDIPAATAVPTAEPTPEPIQNFVTMRQNSALVKAVSTGSFGVANDGSVRFMGNPVSGQNYVSDWVNVVSFAANESFAAALQRTGSILFTGPEGEDPFVEARSWTGLVEVAMGDSHIVGLRSDGLAVAAGDGSHGQLAVNMWGRIKKIEAAGDYTAALTEDGVVTTIGAAFDELVNARPAADISAARDRLAVLDVDGRVRVFPVFAEDSQEKMNEAASGWRNIVKVFAAEGAVYAVDGDGELFTDSPLIETPVSDVYYVSATSNHAIVLHGDGSCEGFGDDSDCKLNVTGWRLLPYVTEEGWLLGMNLGAYIAGSPIATGRELVWTNPATGEEKDAVCVILGDVNGDGKIDMPDLNAVYAHIDGTEPLEGAYLRAANIIMDEAEPDSIDVTDIEALRDHVNGRGVIDQYAKTDEYTALLADARRQNPDALGYITIEGTNISYPIMFGANWFYNDHGFDKKPLTRGCIYYYWKTPSRNIVITGHNSRPSGTMFHQLHDVQDRCEELSDFSNRLWHINTFGLSGFWEVWAMYEEPAFQQASDSSQNYNTCWPDGFGALSEEEREAWIQYQLERTELDYRPNVTTKDRFITILTCGDDHQDSKKGARIYFFLRLVGRD